MAGIYVHIPFCGQFCTYCNFYSIKSKGYKERYIDALLKEIVNRKDFFGSIGVSPQTIYFGGGTPSLFSAAELERILTHLINVFDVSPIEVTLEVNPNDITPQYAKDLHAAGFNRVSMGIQSFIDDNLSWMNRRHKGEEGERAYNLLRDAGFENISLDLIFGYNGLTSQMWEYNLKKITELKPEHISAYQMSIEPGSALWKMLRDGEYDLVPDNICLEQYTTLQKYLQQRGYTQYEVSNFALADNKGGLMKSLHNSSYWSKEPYIGLGPAAHSYNGKIRSWNYPSVMRYCKGEDISGSEVLSGRDIFNESIMLGLRTVEGVDLSTLDKNLLKEAMPDIIMQQRSGNLICCGNNIKIPSDKLFVSDGIIRDLFL